MKTTLKETDIYLVQILRLIKNFKYGKVTYVPNQACHVSHVLGDPVHSLPRISLSNILIISSHLLLGLLSGLFPSRFLAKMFMSLVHTLCPTHLILWYLFNVIIINCTNIWHRIF